MLRFIIILAQRQTNNQKLNKKKMGLSSCKIFGRNLQLTNPDYYIYICEYVFLSHFTAKMLTMHLKVGP